MSRRLFGTIVAIMAVSSMPHFPCDVSRINEKGAQLKATCSGNRLKMIPHVDNNENVTILDLSMNLITALWNKSFAMYRNVEFIDLRFNKIQMIEADTFRELKNLTHLNLSENNLTAIDGNLLADCRRITKLSLARNSFRGVPVDRPFLVSGTLSRLDLSHCEMEEISSEFFSRLPLLSHVDLGGNNITCTAELVETLAFFNEKNITIQPEEFVCSVGDRRMKITTPGVPREKPGRDEVIATHADPTAAPTTRQSSADFSQRQDTGSPGTTTPRNQDKKAMGTPPCEDRSAKELPQLAQNVDELWGLVDELRRETNKLKVELGLAIGVGLVMWIAVVVTIFWPVLQRGEWLPGRLRNTEVKSEANEGMLND